MDGYRQFWNQIYYGTEFGFAGAQDITQYWLRRAVVVIVCFATAIASTWIGTLLSRRLRASGEDSRRAEQVLRPFSV